MSFTPPAFDESAFNCPHCNAFAAMHWSQTYYNGARGNTSLEYYVALCSHCLDLTLWKATSPTNGARPTKGSMIVPSDAIAPLPHPDMPEEPKSDYLEARLVARQSPRAAAALLRLAIEKLCKNLGATGKDINEDIGQLVSKGLPIEIQQALDIVRVIGNNAVHPGVLSPNDVAQVSNSLFTLVNTIVDNRIAQPKKLAQMFKALPPGPRDAIARRDARSRPPSPPAK